MTGPAELASGCPRVQRDTPLGRVCGFERAGAETYLGLPFAGHVGRFRPAAPALPWDGTRDATTYAPRCPQPQHDMEGGLPSRGTYDESCLHLNIHTPVGATGLPVLVWIHGGGFLYGAANEFDGTALAVSAEAVVVTINYRLGLLGWLDMSELGSAYADSGDIWLTDQVEALRWVRDNIAAFGGDPGRVTILGESAGGASVIALCSTERADGLFHRAVACSPPHLPHEPRPDLLARIAKKRRISREQAREWVLTAPADDLVALGFPNASPLTTTGPVYSRAATDAIAARGSASPPLLVGFTSHEGDFFMAGLRSWRFRGPHGRLLLMLLSRSMRTACAGAESEVPAYVRRLRRHYRRPRARRYVELLFSDIFRRASIAAALATTSAGSRGYLYELDVPCRFQGLALRSAHTADLELTFNTFTDPEAWGGYAFLDVPSAPELAGRWVEALARFCRTGDPSGPLGPWPTYDADGRKSLLITALEGQVQADRDGEHRRAVWAEG